MIRNDMKASLSVLSVLFCPFVIGGDWVSNHYEEKEKEKTKREQLARNF